nr:MAG TPA: hypothetical protein [Caudoviricetes sp.]
MFIFPIYIAIKCVFYFHHFTNFLYCFCNKLIPILLFSLVDS